MSIEKRGYLESHLEKDKTLEKSRTEPYETQQRLSEPFGAVDYMDEDEVTLKKNNLELSFSYTSLTPEDIASLNPTDVKGRKINDVDFRCLDNLIITGKDNSMAINIKEILSPSYKIIFMTHNKKPSLGGLIDVKFKTIYIWGDFTNLENIISLLHEIGHSVDFENLNQSDKNNFIDAYEKKLYYKPTKKGLEEVLRRERNAWAFAVKKIKPMLSEDSITKEDIMNFIHNEALSNYSGIIRKQIEGGLYDD